MPGCQQAPALGALPWAVAVPLWNALAAATQGVESVLTSMRRSIEGHTEGPVSAFLWISKTVSFGAVKRNGFWYFIPKGASPWLLVTFCASKKELAVRRCLAPEEGRCPSPYTPSGRCAATSPVQGEATALSKEMGSGKTVPKGIAFGQPGQGRRPLLSRFARQFHRGVGALVRQVPAVEGAVGSDGHRIPHLILGRVVHGDGKDKGKIGLY